VSEKRDPNGAWVANEESNIRRYEAFSDVVIGFSLAQLGASLRIPARAEDLFSDPGWILGFLWAFANICALWWFHHRLFATFWRPKTWPILVNFAWLATMTLTIYATQLTIHLGDILVYRMYFALTALAYWILALQYYLCRNEAGGGELQSLRALRGIVMLGLWGGAFFVVELLLWLPTSSFGMEIWVPIVLAMVASAMLGRRFRRQERALEH
jgi:uncharacterized membrane protein